MTNCIDIALNSQNQTNSDPAAINLFKKDKTQSMVIEPPNSLYKYSLHKTLLEEDEFRKSVLSQSSKSSNKKGGFLKKAAFAGAVFLAAFFLKSKKLS